MGEKIADKKTVDTLALLIASKTGPDDNVASVAKRVIADFFAARKTIKEHNEASEKAEKKAKYKDGKKKQQNKKVKKDDQKTDGKKAKKASGA